MLLHVPENVVSTAIFDYIILDLIEETAIRTIEASGPSLFDSDDCRRILPSKTYGKEGNDLCKLLAPLAKQLCTEKVQHPESLESLLAARMLPLDKNTGLIPIGIEEFPKHTRQTDQHMHTQDWHLQFFFYIFQIN